MGASHGGAVHLIVSPPIPPATQVRLTVFALVVIQEKKDQNQYSVPHEAPFNGLVVLLGFYLTKVRPFDFDITKNVINLNSNSTRKPNYGHSLEYRILPADPFWSDIR